MFLIQELCVYLGCHNPEIRNSLFIGCGFSEYLSDKVLC